MVLCFLSSTKSFLCKQCRKGVDKAKARCCSFVSLIFNKKNQGMRRCRGDVLAKTRVTIMVRDVRTEVGKEKSTDVDEADLLFRV